MHGFIPRKRAPASTDIRLMFYILNNKIGLSGAADV